MLRSAWTEAWDEPGAPQPLPLRSILVADAPGRMHRIAQGADSPAPPLLTYFVGQAVGLMNVVMAARDVGRDMVEPCLDAMERMTGLFADEE